MYNCSTYNIDMYKYYSRKLTLSLSKCGGRNLFGQITVYHRGGGCRRNYRVIDFYRRMNSFGVIVGIEYDPNRSAYIALIYYISGVFSYITAFEGVKLGDIVFSGDALARGNRFILKFVYKFNNVFFEESLRGMCLAGSAVPLFFI